MFSPRGPFRCHSDGCGSGSTEVARSLSPAEDAEITHLIVCVGPCVFSPHHLAAISFRNRAKSKEQLADWTDQEPLRP